MLTNLGCLHGYRIVESFGVEFFHLLDECNEKMKMGVRFFRGRPKLGLESAQLQTMLKPKRFSLLTVFLVWITAKCLLAQSSLLSSGSLLSDPQPDVRIEYVVDAR